MIDVRAPQEYERGAFPSSVNLPLLTDSERHEVGAQFKKVGQDAAIALANELVSGSSKLERIGAWQEYLANEPDAVLYCFRGGLRSHTVQQWLLDRGMDVTLIEGGYNSESGACWGDCGWVRVATLDGLREGYVPAGYVVLDKDDDVARQLRLNAQREAEQIELLRAQGQREATERVYIVRGRRKERAARVEAGRAKFCCGVRKVCDGELPGRSLRVTSCVRVQTSESQSLGCIAEDGGDQGRKAQGRTKGCTPCRA